CTGGSVEDSEEAVTRDVDLAPAKTSQQGADALVVRRDQASPCPVAHPCRGLGRADDVREKDGREDTVEVHLSAVRGGEEPLDGIEELGLIAREREVVGSGELEQPRTGDVCREMARALDWLLRVVDAMRYQHGHLDRGKDVADVNVPIQRLEHHGCARARREAQERRELSTEAG